MKKYMKIIAFLAALLLIGFLIYIVDFFTGYPVSYLRVQKAAARYMEDSYPDKDYVLSKPSYSLKLGGFDMEASIPDTVDDHFEISFYRDGKLKYDNYEQAVLNKANTAIRLSSDYESKVRDIFENSDFPFEADLNGSFQTAISGEKEQMNEPGIYPAKWDIRELTLNGEYDISGLSGQYGTAYLNITSDDVSAKTAAEYLLKLKEIMEKNDLPFKSAELWLMSEQTDDSDNPKEQLHILNFGWDDIYEEELEKRVQEAANAAEEYYNK